MKVKVFGKESSEKGFQLLDEVLGAVKIVFAEKVVIVTADGKVTQLEQKNLQMKEVKK